MNKDVKLTITGIHGKGKDKSVVSTECPGMYFEKNGKIFLKYNEKDADTGSERKSTVKIDDKVVTVEHKGATDSTMIFELGETTRSMYVTSMGSMLIEIKTLSLEIEQRETKIVIDIDYRMSFGEGNPEPAHIHIEAA